MLRKHWNFHGEKASGMLMPTVCLKGTITIQCVNYLAPNPQMSTWYLGALLSGEKMALAVNDKGCAKKCRAMFRNGNQWVDDNLFNGKYYIQKLPKPVDCQVDEGILVDQLVGQYRAHVCGLGYLLKKENIETTLKTIHKCN
ncbi:glycoside hydrolase family 116 protein [Muricauda sp. SCSIO 64092]|uniref:GH116 family glycosyl hydrolase n=1 Tax=Allomuricauda sp. SCSIO 64092 TaxID=2908842 RepID=UPI001FF3FC5D|nr:GH116 family glycosyl hydrolase [Muricauda sp. SCSIO 64092]UOY04934.1 glycoside hydrolase family 116 protein [Muricauda sp. SCSIO 64092]